MSMDLTGINNRNEYYTNHYFASIFEENAADTIKKWREAAQGTDQRTPWALLREAGKRYFMIRGRQERRHGDEAYEEAVTLIARDLLTALGYETDSAKPSLVELAAPGKAPVALEVSKENGAPLLWAITTCPKWEEEIWGDNDEASDAAEILSYVPFEADLRPEQEKPFAGELLLRMPMEELLGHLLYDLDESPRWIFLVSESQAALIDRNKWNEKRFLVFDLGEIFGRNEESTLQAMAVLLHRESLCPKEGTCLLDTLDDNSHKHASGVSRDLKYALRQCIEILGNEVVYDMRERQKVQIYGRALAEDLTLQCLRYMYRILFMLFIEAKPELGYAPMKAQAYESGYSFESLREICEQAEGDGEIDEDGNFLKNSLDQLFSLVYTGFPTDVEVSQKDSDSLQGVFAIDPLKAHIFDPERTALIEKAHLRNSKLMQIINLMSLSRGGKGQRRGRISYSNLGVNQLGAVYEALLSYRGFFAEEDLYEVKREKDKVDELDVGYFIPLRDLEQYTEDERVRNEDGTLRVHPKGEFIYRLAGREREKSASYYTPEVLTRCLVKYALKELLADIENPDDILKLTICEPAMGSAAFLNEAVSQLAEAYLERKQKATGISIPHDQRQQELQKIKMLIADRNVYGIDLNPTAVELAEVSLWLNTIYQGGYVPWFRTQIVNGNSLIGARRQCYTLQQAQAEGASAWYNSAPERVAPNTNRSLRRQQVYHFLLGDPGMCAYTDKVIKELEPEKIDTIKKWNRSFTKPLNDSEADDVLRLCNQIDALWDAHTQLRRDIKEKTTDPLSVWGQEQDTEHQRTTIRDKDRIYDNLYLSKGGSNASPYARLKAVMDYWCALWFWPIDKADELPNRMQFLFDVQMLLGLDVVSTKGDKKNAGQISMFDDFDLDPYAQELSSRYGKYGAVNLDQLRADFPRLCIANEVAEQQKFFHWELEFSDVFEERGGFDLVIGNPPWIKMEWNEQAVLGDRQPLFFVKDYKAAEIAPYRPRELADRATYDMYFHEYESIIGQLNFLSGIQNYPDLKGQQTNLFKCFFPQGWNSTRENGVTAFIHPKSVFDDPAGSLLRNRMYQLLRYHFHFINKEQLFQDVSTSREYGLSVFTNHKKYGFDLIGNLVAAETIDSCYDEVTTAQLPHMFDEKGRWNHNGHPERIIKIGEKELKAIAKVYNTDDWKGTCLLILHLNIYQKILRLFAEQERNLESLGEDLYTTVLWEETSSVKKHILKKDVHFPVDASDLVYSGANIGLANPCFKIARVNCESRYDFDPIDLLLIPDSYMQRCKYRPGENRTASLVSHSTSWGTNYIDEYRCVSRRMLNKDGERTLFASIIPPQAGHIDTVFGMAMRSGIATFAGYEASLPFDFFVKVTRKSDARRDTLAKLPLLDDFTMKDRVTLRALLLNCLDSHFSDLWKKEWMDSFKLDSWAKQDRRLHVCFDSLTSNWEWSTALRNDFERREALVELDVLTAMALGMTLKQLITIYQVQFSVLQKIEADTWYDDNGRIVFTVSTNLPGVGFDRKEWEGNIKGAPDGKKFYRTITDDTQPGEPVQRTIEYVAPFDRCDREKDYETVWDFFSKERVKR